MNSYYSPDQIARVVHAANRELQILQDDPQPSREWWNCTPEMRANAVAGVRSAQEGLTAEELHERWCTHLRGQGWQFGELKDATARTHPCLVPYDDLPEHQRDKDHLFIAIVSALTGGQT